MKQFGPRWPSAGDGDQTEGENDAKYADQKATLFAHENISASSPATVPEPPLRVSVYWGSRLLRQTPVPCPVPRLRLVCRPIQGSAGALHFHPRRGSAAFVRRG